jgi:hypothetical protein
MFSIIEFLAMPGRPSVLHRLLPARLGFIHQGRPEGWSVTQLKD